MKEPQYRGVNELRRMFLEFFESKGHLAMKSFSLVPHNDNSLLLINSGMAPLKPYFTGQEIPPRNRVTTCQERQPVTAPSSRCWVISLLGIILKQKPSTGHGNF